MSNWNEFSNTAAVIDPSTAPAAVPPADAPPTERPIPGELPILLADPLWRSPPRLKTDGIVRSLHNRILPQVGMALRVISAAKPSPAADRVPSFPVQGFTMQALQNDEAAAFAIVESLIAQGATAELILLNLLAPSARLLGEMWENDTTDFANITLAISRLQRILRHVGEAFAPDNASGGTVLLTIGGGEQHSFGMAMVAEFFRQDGWHVCTGPFASTEELAVLVRERWFDFVGFSVGSERKLDEIARAVDVVRRDSRNRAVGIMLGGPMMVARPELALRLGSDLIGRDGSLAPRHARAFMTMRQSAE